MTAQFARGGGSEWMTKNKTSVHTQTLCSTIHSHTHTTSSQPVKFIQYNNILLTTTSETNKNISFDSDASFRDKSKNRKRTNIIGIIK